MSRGTSQWNVLRQIFRNEPIIKRGQCSQAQVPCCGRQSLFPKSYWKLTSLTKHLACTFVFRGDIKPCKERTHIRTTKSKEGEVNGIFRPELDRFLCQPSKRIQQHLRVFVDRPKGVSPIGSQRREPDIDGNGALPQLQKEALLFLRAQFWWTILKVPANFTEPSGRIAIQRKGSLLFHIFTPQCDMFIIPNTAKSWRETKNGEECDQARISQTH